MARHNRSKDKRTRVKRSTYKFRKLMFINLALIGHLYASQYGLYEIIRELIKKHI